VTPVDPCVDPAMVPEGSRPILIAKDQDYKTLPSIITPGRVVITRWELTEEERVLIVCGADLYITIWGAPIRPLLPTIGPIDWRAVLI
jgi:hypothetical protein